MKKLICLALCALLAAALAVPAAADLIWEPDDDFYYSHIEECTRVDASYEAQTDARVVESPTKASVKDTVAAGEEIYVYYEWNGWGYFERWQDGGWTEGWVDLGDFMRLYNEDDFFADHADEIADAAGEIARAPGQSIYLWTFPGSGETADVIDDGFDWADYDPAYGVVYTDENGRTWGSVGYYYGMSGWVCLDDPGADELPATAPRYAEKQPAHAAAAAPSIPTLAIALAAAVVLVTAVVLILLLRRKKASAQ